jgi:hypothetical protein
MTRRLDSEESPRRTTVWLLPDQIAWLKQDPGGMSEGIRSLIDLARGGEPLVSLDKRRKRTDTVGLE